MDALSSIRTSSVLGRRKSFSPPIFRCRTISQFRLPSIVLSNLARHGSVYITGETFSRYNTDRTLCSDYNSAIGKTTFLREELVPRAQDQFGPVFEMNLDDELHIRTIMEKYCPITKAEALFKNVLDKIFRASAVNGIIVIDECHWLFPIYDDAKSDSRVSVFKFPLRFSFLQLEILRKLEGLRNRGIKIVFVSWLHPHDASLKQLSNNYDFDIVLSSPLFEFKTVIDEEGDY